MTITGIECALIGRLGGDAELKTSAAGKPWTAFSVAVGDNDQTQWVRIVAFGDAADRAAGQLHKGDRAYVEGRITMDTWTKDGKERSGLKVIAWRIERLAEIGRNKPKEKAPREAENPAPERRDARSDWQAPPIDDSIIPF